MQYILGLLKYIAYKQKKAAADNFYRPDSKMVLNVKL